MISLNELLSGNKLEDLPAEHQKNGQILLERVNILRTKWGKPMTVTSGYRSLQHHLEIYAKKGIIDQSKIPMKSKHLEFAAVDFSDPDGSLKDFVKANNYQILIDCELWMEAEASTKTWLHVQIFPPKSGNREFNP